MKKEVKKYLQVVFDAFAGINWLTDEHARIILCNPLAEQLSNGSHLPLLEGPKVSLDLSELVLSVAADNKPIELCGIETNVFGSDKIKSINLRIVPLKIDTEESQWILVNLTAQELTEDLSSQTAENEKYKSLTGLAARIAHELNNPLDGSIRYIKLAQRRLSQNAETETTEKTEKVTEYLSSAQEALGKINSILSDLVRFAKNGQSNFDTIEICGMIEQAVRTLSARAGLLNIKIDVVRADNLPRAGGPKMYQVFCNLIKNAIDAIEEKRRVEPNLTGQISIKTAVNNGIVVVTVEDNGVGLPEDRKYLFDPFFTTKEPEIGTGLGLAISQEIVRQYHGKISAKDNENGGACFTVELPAIGNCITDKHDGLPKGLAK